MNFAPQKLRSTDDPGKEIQFCFVSVVLTKFINKSPFTSAR